VFIAGIAAFVVVLVLLVPAIVSGFTQLVQNAPEIVAKIAKWLKPLGIDISQEELLTELQSNADQVISHASDLVGGIFSVTSSILGGLFRWSAIGLFTFYLVAEAPKVRRTVCALLPPERQERVLFIWNEAIDQTGGYFYSRLLLAIINGSLMFVVLLVLGVPFALPLAVFEGLVAEFIPIFGTYLAGAAPILVALADKPINALILFIYITIYQQIENAVLSPRLSARTMELNAGIAFGAAIAGGSIGGIVGAFLALPAAAVIQAFAGNYIKRYEVMESALTTIDAPPPPRAPRRTLWSRYQARRKRTAAPSETGG